MAIIFNAVTNEFHLFNDDISYIIKIHPTGELMHLYYGKHLDHRDSFSHLHPLYEKSYVCYPNQGCRELSFDALRREYPDYGRSDYHEGAFSITHENGSIVTAFVYDSHTIYSGKPPLMERILPATYVNDAAKAKTLVIKLIDNISGIALYLQYSIFSEIPVITRSCYFFNEGKTTVNLTTAMSLSVDFEDKEFELLQLSGAWARENQIINTPLRYGYQSIGSTRGASSHQCNPFIALKRPTCTERSGEIYGFSLVYSGNFKAEVFLNYLNQPRLTMGINPHNFQWILQPGAEFQTPEVVMVYSDTGINTMSQTYHRLFNEHLMAKTMRDAMPPVVVNNWETTYFDFNEEKLLEIAQTAVDVGVETLVLDDGWFENRDDEESGLGDWNIDYAKLPNGLTGLAKKLDIMGMGLGLWIEPESVSPKSTLFQEHPQWVIQSPGRKKSLGRNQYILDFTQPQVIEYIFQKMVKIFDLAPITYLKWDMNRNITEPFSASLAKNQQGEFMHRYILGVYSLLNRLTQKYPKMMIESCAGGGGRFDPGMLFYAPIAWASDNTDAMARVQIQKGTSICYPLRSMGCHVSSVPNHQVGRYCRLQTRMDVATFGAYGFQLDISTFDKAKRQTIQENIERYKGMRDLLNTGNFYRVDTGCENITAWMLVSKNQANVVLGVYECLALANPPRQMIKLEGLRPDYTYMNMETETMHGGDELMYRGISFHDESHYYHNEDMLKNIQQLGAGDFTSKVFFFKAVVEENVPV